MKGLGSAHLRILLNVYETAIAELYDLDDRRVVPLITRLERLQRDVSDQLRAVSAAADRD